MALHPPALLGVLPGASLEARALDELYAGHVAELRRRYDRVLAAHGLDALAIHSGSPCRRSRFDDQDWPLRPCPHFSHWVPLVEAGCLLLVRAGEPPAVFRPIVHDFWSRPAPTETESFREVVEVADVRDGARSRAVPRGGRVAFVGEDPARAADWGLGTESSAPSLDVLRDLDATRTTKTAYEVACLAEANRRARAGHDALRGAFAATTSSELDLHLLYLRATAQDDPDTPYKNIVALGANSATLHHVAYDRRARHREAESLLVDAGASCRGYGADVTRTWVRGGGAAASAFAHLVSGLDAMQQRLCASLRVGAPYEALHDEAHRQAAALLRDVGLVRGSAEAAVASGVTRAFFPHGLGHSLGLQTHDVGCALRAPRADNAFLRNTSDVAPGQVLTIEPGVYFIEDLLAPVRADPSRSALVDWPLVEALTPFGGARVEDDVVVSDRDAIRNLTREVLPDGGGLVG